MRRAEEERAVSPVIATILMVAITVVLAGVLYVWANNLASDGTSNSAGTLHNFRAEDASGAVTTATNDTLMKISWINAPGDLNWAFVSFKVEVGDRSYVCHPIDANAPCVIDQSGGSDIGSWESDEFLYLKENGADICDGSGDSSCSIKLYVSYEGKVVAGTNSLVVTSSGASSGGSGDTTPPVVTVPNDMIVDYDDAGNGNTIVTFNVAATDDVAMAPDTPGDNYNRPIACMKEYPSGSEFNVQSPSLGYFDTGIPVGTTTLTCTGTDAAGNVGTGSFTVTVLPKPSMFVAVGGQIGIITSTDGTSWTNPSAGLDYLRGITYGNNLLVAVGDSGEIATSTNGTGWTSQSSGTSTNLNGVAYGDGTYVVVGYSGTILTSSDGSTWTSRSSGTSKNLRAAAYGNSIFVVVGQNGIALTSSDGSSWSSVSSGTSTQALEGVIYGGGQFVAVGYSDTIITSTSGSVWTSQTSGTSSKHFMAVSYGGGLYTVVSTVNNGAVIITSSDAVNWTTQESGITEHIFGVTYGDGTHVTAGTNRKMHYSNSGTSWSLADTSGLWGHYYGVTYLP
jgi:flagellin-like protein